MSRSEVWRLFEKLDNDKAKCRICNKTYTRGGGTSNLLTHIRRFHDGIERTNNEPPQPEAIIQISNEEKKKIDLKVIKFICRDYQPFSVVDDEGFKELVEALNPRYKLPCRQTISNVLLPNLYKSVHDKLHAELRDVRNVSLTVDSWTSKKQDGYLTVTAHYVNGDKLNSACLDLCLINGSHTADNIASCILDIINSWGLNGKISAVVTDNAANMVAAIRKLNLRHLGCVAHTLNLVVNDGVDKIPDVKEILSHCSTIVTFFKHSNIANEKLKTRRIAANKDPLRLIQHIVTRWNSKLEMISRLLEMKDELVIVLSEMAHAPRTLRGEEWNVLEELVDILKPFNIMTTILSSETHITASKIIPLVNGLVMKLNNLARQFRSDLGMRFLMALQDAVSMRLSAYERKSVSRVATIIDPRFKKEGFMTATNADEATRQLENEVKNILRSSSTQYSASSSQSYESQYWPQNELLGFMAERVETRHRTITSDATIYVRQYIELPPQPSSINPLQFWSKDSPLHRVAEIYACVPATSVPAERIFSKAGQIITERRTCLSSENAKKLVFLNGNQRFMKL